MNSLNKSDSFPGCRQYPLRLVKKNNDLCIKQEEMHEAELFISQISVGIAVFNPQLTCTGWNRFMEHFTGITEKQALGLHAGDLFPGALKPLYFLNLNKALHGESILIPDAQNNFRKTSSLRWTSSRMNPLLSDLGGVKGVIWEVQDITAYKDSKSFAMELYEHAPCGYHSLDKNGYFLSINETELNWLGYTREEIIGRMSIEDLLTPSCKDLFKNLFPVLVRDGMLNNVEIELVRKDGSPLFLELNATSKSDAGGNFLYSRSTLTNISDKKKSAFLISESNKKLRTLIENLHEGVLYTDTAGKIVFANSRLSAMLGYHPDELIGQEGTESLIFSADLLRMKQSEKYRTRGNQYSYEINLMKKDGSFLPVRMHWSLIFDEDGKEAGSMGTFEDISSQKHFEKVIRSKEEHYRTLLESTSDIISIINTDTTIAYVSPSVKKIFSEDPKTLIGKNLIDYVHKEDLELLTRTMQKALSNPGEVFIIEYRTKHGNGGWKTMETAIKALYSNINNSHVFIFNGRDISDHKKTEQLLHYKVNELNTFMYKATHDLRAPLSSLLGLIAIAKTEEDHQELLHYFDLIDISTRKMDKILIDLVDITKITQGIPEIAEVDLQEMLDGIFTSLENIPGVKEIAFETQINLSRPFYTDQKLLGSVMQNLIDNGIKYRKSLQKNFIHIKAIETESSVKIIVSDNGIGIPGHYHKRIFDMFFRATTSSTGTGLGLYIVKSTIEKLGGSIDMESEEHKGTTFTLTLPFNCEVP